MPLTSFICPDNVVRPIVECLNHCPLPTGRCLALSHLYFISNMGRVWTGISSVTQLIKPTRLAYLEIVKDYSVNPDDMAFMMYGTLYHRRLEIINKKLDGLSEYKISGEISGIIDKLEPDELKDGWYKLLDFKLVGAFAIAKALGLQKKDGEVADPDMTEWELQTNKYALMIENDPVLSKLFPISRILIQATIRDGGLKQMNMLKLPRRMPLIPVKRLDKDYINEYFSSKDLALHNALTKQELPPMCDYLERWGNRRCRSYCQLAEFCPEGSQMKKVEYRG